MTGRDKLEMKILTLAEQAILKVDIPVDESFIQRGSYSNSLGLAHVA